MKLTNRIKDLWDTGTRQATSLAERPRHTRDAGRTEWGEWIEQRLAAHPTLTLSAGLLAGVLIGWLVKRR